MKLDLALEQISEIHSYLERSEVYREYRSLPIGLTGLCALVAAVLHVRFFPPAAPLDFVLFWVGVAGLCGGICACGVIYHVLYREDAVARSRTGRVVGQFLPSFVAGLAVTVSLVTLTGDRISLLPGLWAIVFGLGVFASRPYLLRAIEWVALYYLAAGSILLWISEPEAIPSPWGMAVAFGVGQTSAALVLYWNIERKDDGDEKLV